MCGIVGLYIKTSSLSGELGRLFVPMLVEMTDRGPDSAGIAMYRPAADNHLKFTLFHLDDNFNWQQLKKSLTSFTSAPLEHEVNQSHHVFTLSGNVHDLIEYLRHYDADLQIMSYGKSIEIYKETGLPEHVTQKFALEAMTGSHAIGHTRMATESAVTTAGSHPFSTGQDLCLVHNGSLSNHNRLREILQQRHNCHFQTDNDTEVAAVFLATLVEQGYSLREALEQCLATLDGFYTFVAGSKDGFAVLRDSIACKPAVLAETDDYVAFASEYRALAGLPGVEKAKIWEPEPSVVYSWEEGTR